MTHCNIKELPSHGMTDSRMGISKHFLEYYTQKQSKCEFKGCFKRFTFYRTPNPSILYPRF